MADYLIKDIPEGTMKDFKTACAHFKRTMREDLLAGMTVTIHRYRKDIGHRKPKQVIVRNMEEKL